MDERSGRPGGGMNADLNASPTTGLLDRARLFVRDYRHVFIVFAASRFLIFATILFSQLVMVRGQYWHSDGLLPILMNWDGERWYLDIVRHGYSYDRANVSNIAFFPFYPLLVKALSFIIHDVRIAGVLTATPASSPLACSSTSSCGSSSTIAVPRTRRSRS
jgi:hypothetical protein